MTNETLTASEEFKAIEEMDALLPKRTRKVPHEEVSNLLKRHYGFFLPKNCHISLPGEERDYKTFYIYINNSKLGKSRLDSIINSQYFRHLAVNEWAGFVFKIKAGFKKEYNALRGKYELG